MAKTSPNLAHLENSAYESLRGSECEKTALMRLWRIASQTFWKLYKIYPKSVWKVLMEFALRDIGPANPLVIKIVLDLYIGRNYIYPGDTKKEGWFGLVMPKKEELTSSITTLNEGFELYVAPAIFHLLQSPKSSIISNATLVIPGKCDLSKVVNPFVFIVELADSTKQKELELLKTGEIIYKDDALTQEIWNLILTKEQETVNQALKKPINSTNKRNLEHGYGKYEYLDYPISFLRNMFFNYYSSGLRREILYTALILSARNLDSPSAPKEKEKLDTKWIKWIRNIQDHDPLIINDFIEDPYKKEADSLRQQKKSLNNLGPSEDELDENRDNNNGGKAVKKRKITKNKQISVLKASQRRGFRNRKHNSMLDPKIYKLY